MAKAAMRARDNPFCAERIDRIAYIPVAAVVEDLVSKIEQMNFRGAITGPRGAGKTTLLGGLKSRFKEKSFTVKTIFVNDTTPFTKDRRKEFIVGLTCGELVFLDGAEQLGTIGWRRFKRQVLESAAGLVITSHKPGLLETIIECSTTPGLFLEIVSQLTGEGFPLDEKQLIEIYDHHKGNIRNCLRQLYDICAEGK